MAIAQADWQALQAIIDDVWPDVSFGLGQRAVAWHYFGDGSPTVGNCLAVRQYVFENPAVDVDEMAARLAGHYRATAGADLFRVGEDRLLASLVAYNAGHLPARDSGWWEWWKENVAAYRTALAWAREEVRPS